MDIVATDKHIDRPGPFSIKAIASALAAVGVVVVGVLVAAYQTCGFEGCPAVEQVAGFVPDEASIVLDRDGREVDKLYRVRRVVVGLDSLPEHVPQAFIATEDRNFYDHSGVDLPRVVGAAWRNLRTRGIAEGFSTITMQVARNVFPDRLPMRDRTLNRKIAEIRVARQIESRYHKDEILELYMNQIYFGAGAWGIEAAAQEYFGKSATELTLAEAALIAGLPQAPSRLNPRENMEGALERRQTVLRRMEGSGFIDAEQAAEVEPELGRSRVESPARAPHFVEQVRRTLQEQLGDEVYTGGFRIHTTLDLDAQEAVERELSSQLEGIEAGRYGYFAHPSYNAVVSDTSRVVESATTPYIQGAAVVMDVHTGDVLALVGGRDFEDSKFNRATQAKRQPGSAFKPFVYAAAIQAGYPPSLVLDDTPYRLVRNGQVWEPRNYGGSYAGDITMRQALVHSKNVATVRLAEQVGLGRTISVARQLGINSDIPHFPSVAIGAAEVTLLEMVTAYSAFAALGQRPEPRFITRVTDRHDRTIWQASPRTQNALPRDVSFLTVDLMRDVVNQGTGAPIRTAGFRAPAAGKTGTTNESADVWFLGMTPAVAAGIWIGMDERQQIMPHATGGRLAAPVWGRAMRNISAGDGDWSPPPGVERHQVDAFGNVVAANCPTYGELREEYFLSGTVSAFDCPGLRHGYDTLDFDQYEIDSQDWWRALRERIMGPDTLQDTLPPDPATPPDTVTRPDTIIRPPGADTGQATPARPDTSRPPEPLGRPVRPDTSGGGGVRTSTT